MSRPGRQETSKVKPLDIAFHIDSESRESHEILTSLRDGPTPPVGSRPGNSAVAATLGLVLFVGGGFFLHMRHDQSVVRVSGTAGISM